MERIIDLNSYPVQTTLKNLLQDKTTKKNIIWATKSYEEYGPAYEDDKQITTPLLRGLNPIALQPRTFKAMEQQTLRTQKKAEVFTPAWVCNQMNNACDDEWFGTPNPFNRQSDTGWITTKGKICFPPKKEWKDYIDSRRLEITCGEAPYLVSRYDASTGKIIEIADRIGILDRKLRVVNENTTEEKSWFKWTLRAFQSTYGYEYQGDNVLIARINLIMTFSEYFNQRWQKEPTKDQLRRVANIIAWNIWQMDGLTGTVPLGVPPDPTEQIGFFPPAARPLFDKGTEQAPSCRIYDWRRDNSMIFNKLKERKNEI